MLGSARDAFVANQDRLSAAFAGPVFVGPILSFPSCLCRTSESLSMKGPRLLRRRDRAQTNLGRLVSVSDADPCTLQIESVKCLGAQ